MLVIHSTVQNRAKLIVRILALLLPVFILIPLLTSYAQAQSITYVIKDGGQTKIYTTRETDPANVLEAAGVSLNAEDVYTTEPGEDVSEITVRRGRHVTIRYCGKTKNVLSYDETLEALLDRLGMNCGGSYVVSEPLKTATYDGMDVTVDNIVHMEQTYTEELPFETVRCEDPTLPAGTEKVVTAGVPGQLRLTANVVYVNGTEQSRTVLSQTVKKQPVNEVVVVGTGDPSLPASGGGAPAIGDGVIVTPKGEVLTYSRKALFSSTAYTHTDSGCNKITATGTTVRVGTVAVDPSVVAYGTRMFIVTADGGFVYGIATAEDCGGGVRSNHVDLYFNTVSECYAYGVRDCTVYFLN